MIDTVVFTLHDLKYHKAIADTLYQRHNQTGVTRLQKVSDSEKEKPSLKLVDYTYFHETENEVLNCYWDKIPSHNYDIAFKLDFNKDRIEFNCSIPKYYYRTNVFLLTPEFNSPDYHQFRDSGILHQLQSMYPLLKNFFLRFFKDQFDELPWLETNLEINRLDLCYNFVFGTSGEAVDYMNYLKAAKKKYLRKDSKATQYESSVYFPQKNYTFKIYHKLPEFLKHDLKELKSRGHLDKTIERKLKLLASRTIRYEVEFRSKYMNYLFKREIFRSKCPVWKNGYSVFTSISEETQTVNYKGKRIPLLELPRKEKLRLKYVKSMMGRSFHFHLASAVHEWNKSTLDYLDEIREAQTRQYTFLAHQQFGKLLFNQLCKKFHALIKEFQVTYLNDINEAVHDLSIKKANIDEMSIKLNQLTGRGHDADTNGVSLNKLKQVLTLLQTHTFKQIEEDNLVPRRTLMRYKKFMMNYKIDISKGVHGKSILKRNNILLYDNFLLENSELSFFYLPLRSNTL